MTEAEQTAYLDFGTPEELAMDDKQWDAMIAKTTPEQLAKLKRMFADELKREGSVPLEFTNK